MANLPDRADGPATLAELESVIDENIGSGHKLAWALAEIHDRKLYKGTHRSFEAYVLDRFGLSRSSASRWVTVGQALAQTALPGPSEDKPAGRHVPPARISQDSLTSDPPASKWTGARPQRLSQREAARQAKAARDDARAKAIEATATEKGPPEPPPPPSMPVSQPDRRAPDVPAGADPGPPVAEVARLIGYVERWSEAHGRTFAQSVDRIGAGLTWPDDSRPLAVPPVPAPKPTPPALSPARSTSRKGVTPRSECRHPVNRRGGPNGTWCFECSSEVGKG